MRRLFEIIHALQPVHGFILLVVGAVGVFGTFAIGHQIEKGAIESWVRQAELDVSVATTTAQSWLAQSETIISGLALGFEDPDEITDDYFEDLVFQSEDWNSEFSLDAVAIVQRVLRPNRAEMERGLGQALADANDPEAAVGDAFAHMVVVKSTESEGPLRPSVDLLTMPEMGIVATTAQQLPDKAILGPAFTASDGRLLSLVGIGLSDPGGNTILVGRVDLSELIGILLSNYVPEGLQLRMSERDNEARAETLLRPIYGPLEAGDDSVHTVTIRVTRGQARWNYNWDVMPDYLGGAPTAKATMVQIGGLIITVLVVYSIGLLSLQNTLIKAKVREQTKELTEAKAMLLRSHDQLEGLVAQRTAALQESEARYREIFEESPVGIWTEDWSRLKQAIDRVAPNGSDNLARYLDDHPEFLIDLYGLSQHKVEVSEAILALYHAPNKEALLENDRGDLITAEELSTFRNILLSFLSGDWSYDDEGPYRRTDGEIAQLESRLVMLSRHRDEWSRVIYAIKDISERRQAESELGQALTYLHHAQEIAKIDYWFSDGETRTFNMPEGNPGVLGPGYDVHRNYTYEDYVKEFVHPDDRDRVLESYLRSSSQNLDFDFEYRIIAPDGTVRHLREIGKSSSDSADMGGVSFGTLQDITEQKRAEDQLRQSQKMEAVGQLTGGVAHDFNNLLAVIQGNSELLSEEIGSDNDLIQAIQRATTRGAELTQRLLAFSRQQPLQPRPTDLSTLVDGIEELLGRSLGETIEIKTSFPPGLWFAKIDPGQLESALLNLAINARDAMSEGGTLVIEARNASLDDAFARDNTDVTPGDYVMLSVSDNGSGMSAEVLEHALEPFFTTKEVGAGSGLGLSMVYGFAKQSGGHVAISSTLGQGTTVKLYLPRSKVKSTRVGEEAAKEIPSARGEKILVVEDDPEVRRFAVAMLEDLGYQVLQAPDGWTALTLLDGSEPPDLLLSDVVLPRRLSGPDLAEKIKLEIPAIKLLFMSGYSEYATNRGGLAGHDAELLTKPFRRLELALKVRGALDR